MLALKKILPVKQQFTRSAQEYQGRWLLLAGNTLTRYAAGHPSRLSEQVTRVLRTPFVPSREYSEVTPSIEGVAKGSEKKGTTKDTKSTKKSFSFPL